MVAEKRNAFKQKPTVQTVTIYEPGTGRIGYSELPSFLGSDVGAGCGLLTSTSMASASRLRWASSMYSLRSRRRRTYSRRLSITRIFSNQRSYCSSRSRVASLTSDESEDGEPIEGAASGALGVAAALVGSSTDLGGAPRARCSMPPE